MKKVKEIFKKNYKLYFGIILGIVVSSISVYAATTINSKDVEYSNTTSGLTSTNVQSAIDEVAEKAKSNCPDGYRCTRDVKVGDYIKMTPTSTNYQLTEEMTGYSNVQTINPSKVNLWQVTKVNDNGTYEMASYYVSENINFSGLEGYNAYLDTLNKVAQQYMNSRYLISTRYYEGSGVAYSIGTTSAQGYFLPDQLTAADSSGYTRYRLSYVGENGYISPNGGAIVYQRTSAPISNPSSSSTISGGFRITAIVSIGNSMTGLGTKANPYVLK